MDDMEEYHDIAVCIWPVNLYRLIDNIAFIDTISEREKDWFSGK